MAERHAIRAGVASADLPGHLDRTFQAYGRYWAEALWMRPKNRTAVDDGISHEGVEHVERPRDAGTGMIYVLPHLGNWEFAGALAESLEVRVVAVAENLANTRIRDWFIGLRKGLGIDVVLATGSRQVMRDLEAAIADNAAVALLSDRDLKGRGVEVEFFGEQTTLPAGAATLAIRTGAPILPVASYFRPDGGHHIVIRPPIPVERQPQDRSTEVARVTGEIAGELEVLIRRAPEQWHLLQPNWPSDREGET
jgi:KDO2-lipid IV(A) lauroyltransferase